MPLAKMPRQSTTHFTLYAVFGVVAAYLGFFAFLWCDAVYSGLHFWSQLPPPAMNFLIVIYSPLANLLNKLGLLPG